MPLANLTQQSVGKKFVMAVTGLCLIGFIVGHMLGNLTIFIGPDAINAYAKKLQSLGPFLWVIRGGLLAIVALHIYLAVCLTLENRAARPQAYAASAYRRSTYASRTMMMSGLILLSFIIFHLLHFTVKVTHPEFALLKDAHGHHDVYSMVILGFQQPLVSAFYILALVLLCTHLSHGISSLFQSLGLNRESSQRGVKLAGAIIAGIIFLGYASIPLAILVGCNRLSLGGGV